MVSSKARVGESLFGHPTILRHPRLLGVDLLYTVLYVHVGKAAASEKPSE